MNRKHILISSGILALLLIIGGFYFYPRTYAFSKEVEDCNAIAKHLRFSCYRSVLERFYTGNMKSFIEYISKDDPPSFHNDDYSYANFGTNCHTFYHALGDLIATHKEGDIKTLHSFCPLNCTSGCAMGLHKRMALKTGFSDKDNVDFFRACKEEEKHQCSHEVGHTLHDKHVTSILGILDELSLNHYGLKQKESYTYTLSPNPDLDAPFEDCKRLLPQEEWEFCYTGVGHNLFLFSAFSQQNYKTQLDECMQASPEHQDTCLAFLLFRIGINEGAPLFLSGQFEKGMDICNNLITSLQKDYLTTHCYKGIGGGIGLFIESEFLYSQKPIETPQTRKTVLNYARLCENTIPDFTQDCFLGLLGTKFKSLYERLELTHEAIEKLLPHLDDFEVTS